MVQEGDWSSTSNRGYLDQTGGSGGQRVTAGVVAAGRTVTSRNNSCIARLTRFTRTHVVIGLVVTQPTLNSTRFMIKVYWGKKHSQSFGSLL